MNRREFNRTCSALLAAAPLVAPAQPAPTGGLVEIAPGALSTAPLRSAPLADLDGRPAHFEPRRGRPTLVNFWARWCGPCKTEIPELLALRTRARTVDIVGIALETDGAAVREFAHAYDMDYPLLLAGDAGPDLLRALGNPKAGLPFTLVLGTRGDPVALRLGALTRAQLDAAVQRALR